MVKREFLSCLMQGVAKMEQPPKFPPNRYQSEEGETINKGFLGLSWDVWILIVISPIIGLIFYTFLMSRLPN